MEKPKFLFGSEERFLEFFKGIREDDTLVAISHTDLDGIASAKVIGNSLNVKSRKFVNYNDLNKDLINWIREKKATKVIFTDLFLKDSVLIDKLEDFCEILVIDHHPADKDYNSDKIIFLNAQGFCAGYLCYYLFSKVKDLSKIDWIVACSSVSDILYRNNQTFMKETFEKYGDNFEYDERDIRKSGRFWDVQWKLSMALVYNKNDVSRVYSFLGDEFELSEELEEDAEIVQKEYDLMIGNFENEKKEIPGGYFWENKSGGMFSSFISTSLSFRYFDKTIVIASSFGDEMYKFSARRQDKKEDMNVLARKLVEGFDNSTGGGHVPAAGGSFPVKYKEEFLKRLGVES